MGAAQGPKGPRAKPVASLAWAPESPPSFVPRMATLLRFLAPFRNPVNEYLNYMGSKEWSWPQVNVNAFICVCSCLLICAFNWEKSWMFLCCSWLALNRAPGQLLKVPRPPNSYFWPVTVNLEMIDYSKDAAKVSVWGHCEGVWFRNVSVFR